MTMHATIYSRCPACRHDALVQTVQGTYRCANCNFDYLTLADDRTAREAWMLENLRLGSFSILFVMHLHRMILALPVGESNAQVLAFAAQHGIELPKGNPFSVKKIVALVIGGLVLLFAIIGLLNHFLA